jgi:hypothetical protein
VGQVKRSPTIFFIFFYFSANCLPKVILYDNIKGERLMPWYEVFWNYEDADGNVAHIAENGLTPEEVDFILMDPEETAISRASGRPIAFGFLPDGRYVCVVYEVIDESTLYPVTAFEIRR